jgi:hypothetical protein
LGSAELLCHETKRGARAFERSRALALDAGDADLAAAMEENLAHIARGDRPAPRGVS